MKRPHYICALLCASLMVTACKSQPSTSNENTPSATATSAEAKAPVEPQPSTTPTPPQAPSKPTMTYKIEDVGILSISATTTNYSIAPRHRKTTRQQLSLSAHQEKVEEALDTIKVNDAMPLRAFLLIVMNKDTEALKKIGKEGARIEEERTGGMGRPKGGSTTTTTLVLSKGGSYEIGSWGEAYTGFSHLHKLLDEHGTSTTTSANSDGLPPAPGQDY